MITIISALLGAALLYAFLLSFYRLTLHPLAKYPGPKLNAVSEWPQAIFNIRGRAHIAQYQLHEKYGDVVRVAPNVLLFRTVKAAHDIYDRKANVIKAGWTDVALKINPSVSTHNLTDRQIHAKRRRMLANAFSDSALRNQEHLIIDRIQSFCEIMSEPNNANSEKKGWGQPRDMSTWANNLTLDVLGELCFGKTFGALEAGSHMIGELLVTSSAMNQAVSNDFPGFPLHLHLDFMLNYCFSSSPSSPAAICSTLCCATRDSCSAPAPKHPNSASNSATP